MNNKSNKKLLVLSILFIIFGATITLANKENNNFLNVRPVLNRAIQTIQKIAFNVDAIRHPDALDKEVIVESNHGTVLIRGRIRALVDGTTGTLTPDSTGSSLFYGNNNYLAGPNSYIIAGESNTITSDVSESAIIGGTNNTLITGSSIYIIGGSGNSISGVNSYIVGGHDNKLEGNNSYIIGGSFSEVHGSGSIAAGSDIYIDKDNVFAWKDTSDDVKLNPKKDNTFILFAQNGISIGYDQPKDSEPGTVDIHGIFQVSTERKRCGINIAGAVQYLPLVTGDVVAGEVYQGELYGCFCTCDGSEWVSMIPSRKCRDLCPSITGAADEDFQKGVCRYTLDQNAHIWSIDPSQACDNGEATGFNTEWLDGQPYRWTWSCVGNVSTATNCGAMAKRQNGQCSSNPKQPGHADYFNKCVGGYPSVIKNEGDNLFSWICKGINGADSAKCTACNSNWNYYAKANGKWECKDENGHCNGSFNGKNLGELSETSVDSKGKGLCTYRESGSDIEFQITVGEDGNQNGWIWKCKGEQSTAQCSATYRVDPGRCVSTNAPGISEYAKCQNGQLTGVREKDPDGFARWTCAGVNHPLTVECKGCGPNYRYNRQKDVCERTCCEYETGVDYTHLASGYIVANTCHKSITLMDKNLGSDVRYDWTYGQDNEDLSIGYYYQRGNNYGFSLENGHVKEGRTRDRPDWDDKYNKSGYYDNKFIVSSPNEEKCLQYNYWSHPGKNKTCTVHRDIWGGGIDGYVAWCYGQQYGMDTMYRVHTNDIIDYIYDRKVARHCGLDVTDFMLDTGATARQGPCPEGWHVPSAGEWGQLLTAFCEWNPAACKDDTVKNGTYRSSLSKGILTRSVANETLGSEFSKAFYLPRGGRILADSNYPGKIMSKNAEGFYWSSSYMSDEYVGYLWFNKAQIYATEGKGESKRGVPIRCFKNPVKIDDNDPDNACPDLYRLTIKYTKDDGSVAHPDFVVETGANKGYNVPSPTIEGFTADKTTVSGTMPNHDETITVTYTNNHQH